MKPFTRSIIELFDGKKRYLIPLYQRQYAWKVFPQLELLWEDIERAVDRIERDRQSATPHFMGAIVISQIKTFGKEVQAFEVIDGQQRLTTFQLLLAAFRDVVAAHGSDYGAELDKLLFNDGVMERPEVERYKLWPSLSDRRTYIGMVDPDADLTEIKDIAEEDGQADMPARLAHSWLKNRIALHVQVDDTLDSLRVDKLYEALRNGLAAVSIELEGGDDPQTIFETLNSRGVDLSQSDLMRNFIFQRAKGMGQDEGSLKVDKLYTRYWVPLDRDFWRTQESRGRLSRTRLDWLLTDHLAMKLAKSVSVEHLFEAYRRWILSASPFPSVEAELISIDASAAILKQIFEQASGNALGEFGRFAKAFDVSTAMPLVLFLATDGGLAGEELKAGLEMIESFILRRDICGLPTKNYNNHFVDILSRIRIRISDVSLLSRLEAILSLDRSDLGCWPDDKTWQQGWMTRPQYKNNRQPRLRYLFEKIEQAKRTSLSEEIEIKSELSIEHIMPQNWRKNWPITVEAGDQEMKGDADTSLLMLEKEVSRQTSVDLLGNLTLLTQKLNSTISDGPFAVKMQAVRANASLALNRELHVYDHWDESNISLRGKALYDIAATIWRAPASNEGSSQIFSTSDHIEAAYQIELKDLSHYWVQRLKSGAILVKPDGPIESVEAKKVLLRFFEENGLYPGIRDTKNTRGLGKLFFDWAVNQ